MQAVKKRRCIMEMEPKKYKTVEELRKEGYEPMIIIKYGSDMEDSSLMILRDGDYNIVKFMSFKKLKSETIQYLHEIKDVADRSELLEFMFDISGPSSALSARHLKYISFELEYNNFVSIKRSAEMKQKEPTS